MMHYDYIIAGAGCAGLSLAVHMIDRGLERDKRILVLDRDGKTTNDRTWCFWEKSEGLFEEAVFKSWHILRVCDDGFEKTESVAPYTYKMIRGEDFYRYCKERMQKSKAFEWRAEGIRSVVNTGSHALVETTDGTYRADRVFCSILLQEPALQPGDHYLLQHFKGRTISSPEPVFDPDVATLMDFAVDQAGDTAFVYVLPTSPHTALVEYTIFGPATLEQSDYDKALDRYIREKLQLRDIEIIEEEFGVIPMTTAAFPLQEGRIIFMGTAAGNTKASTGYTFQFIQAHCRQICDGLQEGRLRLHSVHPKRFQFYDRVLLYILAHRLLPGKKVFVRLFRKNRIARVLAFLENSTGLPQELKIIWPLQKKVFLKAAWRSLRNLVSR